MKRLIALVSLALAAALPLGIMSSVADPEPASAHVCGAYNWPWGDCFDICKYIAKNRGYGPWPPWYVDVYDSWVRHYNGAHILTCAIRLEGATNSICFDYVIETGSLSPFRVRSPGNCFV